MDAKVPCASCGRAMPAARLQHPSLHGLCSPCKSDERAARAPAPMYESEAWERGIKL